MKSMPCISRIAAREYEAMCADDDADDALASEFDDWAGCEDVPEAIRDEILDEWIAAAVTHRNIFGDLTRFSFDWVDYLTEEKD